jgi:hypothetical protein
MLTAGVTTHGYSSSSTQVATVYPQPTVSQSTNNYTVNSGQSLIIYGSGFSTVTTDNTVAFNLGAVGTVTAATASSLTVSFSTWPTAGDLTATVTTYGSISSGSPVQVATVSVTSVAAATGDTQSGIEPPFGALIDEQAYEYNGFGTEYGFNTLTYGTNVQFACTPSGWQWVDSNNPSMQLYVDSSGEQFVFASDQSANGNYYEVTQGSLSVGTVVNSNTRFVNVSDGFGGYTGSLGDAYFGFVLHAGNISGFNGTYYGWVQFSDEPLSDNDDQYGGAPIMWIQTIVTSTVNNASVTVGTTT